MTTVSSSKPKVSQDIILRALSQADAPAIVEHLNTPEIAEWLAALPQPFSPDHVALLFDLAGSENTFLRGIEYNGTLAGCLCLGTNTWFWLAPEFWQTGVMTAALHNAMTIYFANQAPPLYATARADNIASKALLSKLGFAALPDKRRMFFQGAGKSYQCQDFVLASEQWHLVHPPHLTIGGSVIQPATHKDVSALASFIPKGPPWPDTDLLAFIEQERFRGGFGGLFVIHDDNRQMIGAALLQPPATIVSTFISNEKAERYSQDVDYALSQKFSCP